MRHRHPLQVALPDRTPRTHGRAARWIGRTVLWLGGWRIAGAFPAYPRLMILAAPHSSGWDAVWGLAAKLGLGLDIKFMAKAELFVGPLGWLLTWLGGIPTNRSAPGGLVGEMTRTMAESETLWLVVAPEGTRKRVERWKSGFWRIARPSDVPVVCAYFHYPDRTIGVGEVFQLSDDMPTDIARIRAWYRPWVGKHRGTE